MLLDYNKKLHDKKAPSNTAQTTTRCNHTFQKKRWMLDKSLACQVRSRTGFSSFYRITSICGCLPLQKIVRQNSPLTAQQHHITAQSYLQKTALQTRRASLVKWGEGQTPLSLNRSFASGKNREHPLDYTRYYIIHFFKVKYLRTFVYIFLCLSCLYYVENIC